MSTSDPQASAPTSNAPRRIHRTINIIMATTIAMILLPIYLHLSAIAVYWLFTQFLCLFVGSPS